MIETAHRPTSDVGSCSACNEYSYRVNEIRLIPRKGCGATVIRLCLACATDLRRLLR